MDIHFKHEFLDDEGEPYEARFDGVFFAGNSIPVAGRVISYEILRLAERVRELEAVIVDEANPALVRIAERAVEQATLEVIAEREARIAALGQENARLRAVLDRIYRTAHARDLKAENVRQEILFLLPLAYGSSEPVGE